MTTERAPISAAERILAFMALGIAVVALVCLIVVIGAPVVGVDPGSMTTAGWQLLFLIAYFGFPVAFVLMLSLFVIRIVSNRRRRKVEG